MNEKSLEQKLVLYRTLITIFWTSSFLLGGGLFTLAFKLNHWALILVFIPDESGFQREENIKCLKIFLSSENRITNSQWNCYNIGMIFEISLFALAIGLIFKCKRLIKNLQEI